MEFIQYMRPDGQRVKRTFDASEGVERLAAEVVEQGWRFEAEVLPGGYVSLTCEPPDDDEEFGGCIEVVPNGPKVPGAVAELVRAAHKRCCK